jgi:hypothetical protein
VPTIAVDATAVTVPVDAAPPEVPIDAAEAAPAAVDAGVAPIKKPPPKKKPTKLKRRK